MSRQHDPRARKAFCDTFLHGVRHGVRHVADLTLNISDAISGTSHECKNVYTKKDLKDIILRARKERKIVRVHGSEHSPADHILHDDEAGYYLNLKGELQDVIIDRNKSSDDKLYVTARGGCFLGYNPNKKHEEKNSLCYKVHEEGFALPSLGGITHQTIAGFLSTGSAGGSLNYSFSDTIEEIKFINGEGIEKTCSKNEDLFNAVGVSMGLFGIITEVTFCFTDKKYNVVGAEENKRFEESFLEDPNSLINLHDQYWRFNWFPQKYCNIVTQWIGKRSDFNSPGIPYVNFINSLPAALGAAGVMTVCNELLYNKPGEFTYKIIGNTLKLFVCPEQEINEFDDVWYHALPMDNEAHVDDIIKVDFTEVWIPFTECEEVINRLKRVYDDTDSGQRAAGNFAVEIYPAKKSNFWLSMSYGQNMIRVDPYWFSHNPCGEAREYFTYVWNALLPMKSEDTPVRLHWGKYLPEPNQELKDKDDSKVVFNVDYLKSVYDKLDDWLQLREENDPNQVFVNRHWRSIFDIRPLY